MHFQPRLRRGSRIRAYTTILPAVIKVVDAEARRYGVTRSWVICVRLAQGFGLHVPDFADYRTEPWRKAS